jgi:hypothetical protein
MNQPDPEQLMINKNLVRGGLAASAPGLPVLVVAFTVEPVDLLQMAGMGQFGLVGLAVVLFTMGYLLRKARWWAGIPGLIAAAWAMVYFARSFVRPLNAYLEHNQTAGFTDLIEPLMLLSPQLVIILISFTLGLVVFKTMRLAWGLAPLPVNRYAWIMMAMWLVIAGGDVVYQHSLWQKFGGPRDMVLRLCIGESQEQERMRRMLLNQGAKAAPALIEGLYAGGKAVGETTDCMRISSRELLITLGPAAVPALREAAAKGDKKAAAVLEKIIKPGK